MSETTPTRDGRLAVGVVGAGRVGTVLAAALRAAGHTIVSVSGSSVDTVERIEALLPGVPVRDPDAVLADADLVLLTVPDDELAPLVAGFAALGLFRPGQLVVHTAGRYGTDVLALAAAAGAIPLAIHPAMTFTGTSIDLDRIVGVPFAVTAGAAVLPIAQALVVEMEGEPIVLPETARGAYHAALAHGANHLVTLVAQAERILTGQGVVGARALLTPLLIAALDGALTSGERALTGPVRRGDAGTVATHVATLAALPSDPDILTTYVALARATAARCLAGGQLTPDQAARVLDALEPAASASTSGTAASKAEAATGAGLIAHTVADLRRVLGTGRGSPDRGRRAVVMTMGALHAGHLELVRHAKTIADEVVVTIFVNPLQFGPGEDLGAYPRTLEADLEALRSVGGVDVVFAPSATDMYPREPRITMRAGAMGEVLEGAARPGHFDGMLTVVNKLLHLTRPDVALFGQKDAQQLAIVRAMVADFNLDVEIVAVPIARDGDGLALSSRNAYLSEQEREAARILSRTLRAGVSAAAGGGGPEAVLAAARYTFSSHQDSVELAYLTLVDPETMQPLAQTATDAPALLAIAARFGNTRLLDNAVVDWNRGMEKE